MRAGKRGQWQTYSERYKYILYRNSSNTIVCYIIYFLFPALTQLEMVPQTQEVTS